MTKESDSNNNNNYILKTGQIGVFYTIYSSNKNEGIFNAYIIVIRHKNPSTRTANDHGTGKVL